MTEVERIERCHWNEYANHRLFAHLPSAVVGYLWTKVLTQILATVVG